MAGSIEPDGAPVNFQLLGPFRAMHGSVEFELGGARERRLLIALLRSAGHWISREELVGWVWDHPPTKPLRALDEVASDLRAALAASGLDGRFKSKAGLCRIEVRPDTVDAHRLRYLAARADEVRGVEHRDLLRAALGLRRGEPLEDVTGDRIDTYRRELAGRYRRVEIAFNQLEVRSGRAGGRLIELERLHEDEPADVLTAGLFICALHLVGNPTRAHAVLRAHRDQLVEVGLEVPRQIADLQQALYTGETDLGVAGAYFLGGPLRPAEDDSEPAAEVESGGADETTDTAARPLEPGPRVMMTTNSGVVNSVESIRADYVNLGIDRRGIG
ncbi:winged helix-turn-helix domain-containing protein [Nocardia beijingensis]|uniref:AfsR/SARP family transcriptional regulator n=1 Tax=Nocardia beijingensis TaxID=95162 RepID=UPI0018946E65|nr:winged helix-turn-helix domain-containing protein [Nocardia beijingensis]MBF6469956.1 winged helix-turn-helix domain-containing protein [Nocardia beijingensis]